MRIFPELSKNSWKVLIFLSRKSTLPSEIARVINIPLSRVSEALKQLNKENILKPRNGYQKLVIDASLENVINRFLIDYSETALIGLLNGKKLNILMQISEDYDTVNKLKLITGYSTVTLRRALKECQDALLIYQPKIGTYQVRNAVKQKVNLLKSVFIASSLGSLTAKGVDCKEFYFFGDILLLTSSKSAVDGFTKTGFRLFHKYRIGLFETNDSYFVNMKKEPTKEEVFMHALVFSMNHQRDMILCMLFADLNKLKLKKLGDLPLVYKLEKEVVAIFEFLKTNGQKRAVFLPSYNEYMEIRRDYARN